MRIAYLTETFPPEINGVSLTAERTLRALRRSGHEVQLVRPRQRGEAQRCDAQECLTPGLPIPMYRDLQFGWAGTAAMRRLWRAQRPDLVHAVTPGPLACTALRAARAEGITTSSDFRTDFPAYARHYRAGWAVPLIAAWLRQLNRLSDLTFVPTTALAERLAADGFERLRVCGRGVDTGRFDPVRRDCTLRASWGAGEHDPVLLYVGRLAAEKNVGLALQAFETLRARQPRLVMVVVGDGPLAARLQARHPRAWFVGTRRDVDLARHYASADVFLFPSLTDTFGNVTLEALASGLALVAYDRAAAAAHVTPGLDGLLAAPGDEAGFLTQAARVLEHAALGSPMRCHARAAAQLASWDRVAREFELALRSLVAARRVPRVEQPTPA